jgi:hypothetical protein
MSGSHAAELLAQVEKSPAAVAIHDKQAWMSIFAQYHIVEDPVGSKPHVSGIYDSVQGQRGNGPLSRFFDTFIAPNQISFDVHRDIVCENHVVRDLTIHIQMSERIHAQVPMHLLYELIQEKGEWKIVRLAAHWELMPMIFQLLGKGFACFGVLAALTVRMLKLQGIGGMLGFSKAALNIGSAGKKAVREFEQAFNNHKLADLMGVCSSDADMVSWPLGGKPVHPSQLLEVRTGKLAFSKILAAGDSVTSSFSITDNDGVKEGVAIFEFNRSIKKISAVRFYY